MRRAVEWGVVMLSELQQKRVWEGWLSAEVRANYFADLAGVYHQQQRMATWAAVFFSSGAVVAFLANLPPAWAWLAPAFAIVTAALSGYSLVAQHQEHAVTSSDLHFRWNRLASDYEALWDDMYASEAAPRLAALTERGAELSKAATAAGLPNQERRMLKWQELVEQHHTAAAHATATP
jgi:hypothetical protein